MASHCLSPRVCGCPGRARSSELSEGVRGVTLWESPQMVENLCSKQRRPSVPESRDNRCEQHRMGKRKGAERQGEVKGSHRGCPATVKGALDLGTSSVLLLPHSPPRLLPFLPLPHPRLTSSSTVLLPQHPQGYSDRHVTIPDCFFPRPPALWPTLIPYSPLLI